MEDFVQSTLYAFQSLPSECIPPRIFDWTEIQPITWSHLPPKPCNFSMLRSCVFYLLRQFGKNESFYKVRFEHLNKVCLQDEISESVELMK